MMSVTAVIPHWNRRELLQSMLASMRDQTRPFDEVIVADNGSTDGSAEFAEQQGACVLRLGSNLGFAAAGESRNRRRAIGMGPRSLNNDVTLDAGWLAATHWGR